MRAGRSVQGLATEALESAFGFDPAESEAHFMVYIPADDTSDVLIREQLVWNPTSLDLHSVERTTRNEGQLRCLLGRVRWSAIANVVRAEFNARLRSQERPAGKWHPRCNPVARTLGKELTVLAWAIEEADPGLVETALANWLGLSPEERWWLYTMAAASAGHWEQGRGRGWRRAIRYALTDTPTSGIADGRPQMPDAVRRALGRAAH